MTASIKIITLVYFSFILTSVCIGQAANTLEIIEIFITDSSEIKTSSDFKIKNKAFYEDEKYLVRTTCHGEFGGSVWFKNKKTGIEYSCSSTCPDFVNFLDGKYYVTNNLMHMSASTYVIEIKDPSAMSIFKKPSPKQKWHRAYEDSASFSEKGRKILADTSGILTIASFISNQKLYHLMSTVWNNGIYVSTIKNGHFHILDSIPDGKSIYFTNKFETTDGHYVMFFDSDPVNGYIDIHGNKVKIFRYDRLKDRKYDPVLAYQRTDLEKQRYHLLIDSFYNRKFDKTTFPKNFYSSGRYNVKFNFDLIYQAIFNSDSSKFIAFYINDEKGISNNSNQYQAENVAIWGRKIDNKWNYMLVSHGIHTVFYANNRQSMQRYNFNHLQKWHFFEENSVKLNKAFWESSNFKELEMISDKK